MEISKTKSGNWINYKKSYSISEINDKIKSKEATGISIDFVMTGSLKDINFLRDIDNLEHLQIDLLGKVNYNVVNSLISLKSLFIANASINYIAIDKLINLEKLVLLASSNVVGIEACTRLESLRFLPNFHNNMEILANLYQLKLLEIQENKVDKYHLTTLNGIENATNLMELRIKNCKKLKSINKLSNLKKLKKIDISYCKKIEDFNQIEILPDLELFHIINCGKITSLDFVRNFPNLKELNFRGNTEIVDGNLKHISHVKKVYYESKPHYYRNKFEKWIKGI